MWFWPGATAGVTVVVALICTLGTCVGYQITNATRRGDLEQTLDAVAVPAEATVIHDQWSGNALCIDNCLRLSRRYSSPWSRDETYRIFAAALDRAGYQCKTFCQGFDAAGHTLVSKWQQADHPTLNLIVFSTADTESAGLSLGPPLDAARQVHVDLRTES